MFDVEEALRELVKRAGSDLHLKVGVGAAVPRQRGSRSRPERRAAHRRGHRGRAEAAADRRGQARRVRRRSTRSTSPMKSPNVARFRINAFHQRGPDLAGLSRDPAPDQHDRRARAAAGGHRTRRRGARDRAADRHDRLGQVDDARRDDRPHELHDEQAHRHDRGPDRVRARRQALGDQPARSRHGHGLLQARAAQGAAPGPRRDPDRRDARRGDGPDRAVGGRDRAPRALDDPHRRCDRVDQPHARLLPAPPALTGAQHDRGHAQGRDLPATGARRRRRPRRGLRDPAHDRTRARHDRRPDADGEAASR